MFLFKGKFIQQINDVALGLSLGPTLANFFLVKMEKKIMSIGSVIIILHLLLYLWCVNDIFAVFETNKSCLKVLDRKWLFCL